MEQTIRIASWTIVAGSLLVLGKTLFMTALDDFELPDVNTSQAVGTVIREPAPAPEVTEPEPDSQAAAKTESPAETPEEPNAQDDTAPRGDDAIVLVPPG